MRRGSVQRSKPLKRFSHRGHSKPLAKARGENETYRVVCYLSLTFARGSKGLCLKSRRLGSFGFAARCEAVALPRRRRVLTQLGSALGAAFGL
jgi:hypothetical protein